MTSPSVGTARYEITADLTTFAEKARVGIEAAVAEMSEVAGAAIPTVTEEFGAGGESAGLSFGARLRETLIASTTASVTEAGEAATVRAGEEGERAGAVYAERFAETSKETLMGLGGFAVAGIGALGVAELVKNGVEAADALEGANEKIEGVFGESGKAVANWASGVAVSLRLSQSAAETQAGTFGQFLHSFGVGQEEAAGMSMKLVDLTANIAKFNNADPTAVQTAITSALRGRATAMKQFGVTLDAATISQEALAHADEIGNLTMKDGVPVLTAQQKGIATYYALLDQTKNQQGALASSTDTLAQQQKIMGAEFANAEAKIGNFFLPVLAKVATFISEELIPGVGEAGHWIGEVLAPYFTLAGNYISTQLIPPITELVDWVGPRLVPVLREAFTWFSVNILPILFGLSGMLLTQAIPAIKALLPPIMDTVEWFGIRLLPVLRDVAGWFQNDILPAIAAVSQHIREDFLPVVQAVSHWLSDNGPTVRTFVGVIGAAVLIWKAWTLAVTLWSLATRAAIAVQAAFDAVLAANPIVLVVLAIAALAAGIVYAYGHFKIFRTVLNDIWSFLKTWGTTILAVMLPFIGIPILIYQHWSAIVGFLTTAWNDVVNFLITWGPVALAVILPFIGIPLLIWQHFGAIEGYLSGAFSSAMSAVSGFVSQAVSAVEGLGSSIVTAITSIPGKIGALAGDFVTAGGDLIAALGRGLGNGVAAAFDLAGKLKKAINDGIGLPHTFGPWGINEGPIHIDLPTVTIPGFAAGGGVGDGSFRVGEYGPEILEKRGANLTVATNQAVRRIDSNEGASSPTAMMSDEQFAALLAALAQPTKLITTDGRELAKIVNTGNARLDRVKR